MKPHLIKNALFWACIAFPGMAFAEKADRDKPMNIEADNLRQDDLKQISIFSGRVVLTKGTIIVRGGQLTVRQDSQGYQHATVLAEPGKLAFYRQKREGVDEYMEGEGEAIEYDGRADTVEFIKRAQLRRYIGSRLNDEMIGGFISYNNTTEVFNIDGEVARGATVGAGGRVRAMLTPKSSAAASSQSKSVDMATVPMPALRAAPALEAGSR
ncbi:MAG: hypothetical protein RL211_843 [Pseudomonadota bacterium]|jgi:lipopolysaccharide export system protein LptA